MNFARSPAMHPGSDKNGYFRIWITPSFILQKLTFGGFHIKYVTTKEQI